jgi:hypothetical protein
VSFGWALYGAFGLMYQKLTCKFGGKLVQILAGAEVSAEKSFRKIAIEINDKPACHCYLAEV